MIFDLLIKIKNIFSILLYLPHPLAYTPLHLFNHSENIKFQNLVKKIITFQNLIKEITNFKIKLTKLPDFEIYIYKFFLYNVQRN